MLNYTKANPPKIMPVKRAEVLPFEDKDPFNLTPRGGFLEDVENYTLGYETTNAFSFWTGVHFLSSILKRDVWMPWGAERHFPNFFLILLAHPGLVKKSTTMRLLDPVFDSATELISRPALKWRKEQGLTISSTATANGMFKLLEERSNKVNKEFSDAEGNPIELISDANLIIRVSEFTTLVNKAQYNANLIDKITDFYDCKDYDTSTTVSHGNLELKKVFCTMLGATTPSSFQTSMTQEAYGGGFMSRCIVVKESTGYRKYPLPVLYPGAPDQFEMARRLAFIAEHAVGSYTLSPEAYDLYVKWYVNFKEQLQDEDPDEILHQDNRRDINVLKLALVLAAQSYTVKNTIDVEDVASAIQIMDWTIERAADDVDRAAMNPENILQKKVEATIQKAGKVGISKSALLRNHSRLINAQRMNEILSMLFEMDDIYIRDSSGNIKHVFEGTGEIYIHKGRK